MHTHTPSPTLYIPQRGSRRGAVAVAVGTAARLPLLPLTPGWAREEEWNPKAAFGSILLAIVGDGLRRLEQKGCQGSATNNNVSEYSAYLQKERKKKKNQKKKKEKKCWSAIATLLCMDQRWNQTLKTVSWWLSCRFIKDVQPSQLRWVGIGINLLFGAVSNLKPRDCPLHSAQTLRNIFSFPWSPRDPLDSSQKPGAPPWTTSFSGANLCKKSKGAFYHETLHIQHFPTVPAGNYWGTFCRYIFLKK